MLMKNCKCCVFKFLFLFRFLWFLASMLSRLLMNESRFTCSYLIVYWCKSIVLFFLRCCMLNEICFDWNCKTWNRWNFVIIDWFIYSFAVLTSNMSTPCGSIYWCLYRKILINLMSFFTRCSIISWYVSLMITVWLEVKMFMS